MRAILATGLETSQGFFHTPRSAAYPLVLDLMELFRVPFWDMVLIGSLNRGQRDPDADFFVTKGKVWLSEAGRRRTIGLFESRRDETWKHPVIGYSLSYARTLELEARLLRRSGAASPAYSLGCGSVDLEGIRERLAMNDAKWWLVCYDVHDPVRLRRGAKVLEGSGWRMQESVFRCWMTSRQMNCLLWELMQVLQPNEEVLSIPLCTRYVADMETTYTAQNSPN